MKPWSHLIWCLRRGGPCPSVPTRTLRKGPSEAGWAGTRACAEERQEPRPLQGSLRRSSKSRVKLTRGGQSPAAASTAHLSVHPSACLAQFLGGGSCDAGSEPQRQAQRGAQLGTGPAGRSKIRVRLPTASSLAPGQAHILRCLPPALAAGTTRPGTCRCGASSPGSRRQAELRAA